MIEIFTWRELTFFRACSRAEAALPSWQREAKYLCPCIVAHQRDWRQISDTIKKWWHAALHISTLVEEACKRYVRVSSNGIWAGRVAPAISWRSHYTAMKSLLAEVQKEFTFLVDHFHEAKDFLVHVGHSMSSQGASLVADSLRSSTRPLLDRMLQDIYDLEMTACAYTAGLRLCKRYRGMMHAFADCAADMFGSDCRHPSQ